MDVAFNERFDFERPDQLQQEYRKGLKKGRVSVQGVKSLGGHFACLCRGFDFYEVKKNK